MLFGRSAAYSAQAADLARATGISGETISAILAGKRRIALTHVPKFAAFFDLPMHYFIDEVEG
ncbi:MAG: helix-turn-helix transcriptional regulator [Planctomycetaceae bacterium]|nr:helix-turn-helix transcriptional regulator [Planctomycetaceae bacterium]